MSCYKQTIWRDNTSYLGTDESLAHVREMENDGLKNTIWFADRVVNIPSSVRTCSLPTNL